MKICRNQVINENTCLVACKDNRTLCNACFKKELKARAIADYEWQVCLDLAETIGQVIESAQSINLTGSVPIPLITLSKWAKSLKYSCQRRK